MAINRPTIAAVEGVAQRHGYGRFACWIFLSVWIGIAGGLSACSSSSTAPTSVDPGEFSPAEKYVIGPSDVLSIGVWNHKELNRTVTVRPDGKISFSLVGDIVAAGLAPWELQVAMEQALKDYINIVPGEVTVVVDEVHSYKVSVTGEVREPGRFEFHNQVSILDALAAAGGLTEFASRQNIVIFRQYHGQPQRIEFDYDSIIKSKTSTMPVLLFPGDIILVP